MNLMLWAMMWLFLQASPDAFRLREGFVQEDHLTQQVEATPTAIKAVSFQTTEELGPSSMGNSGPKIKVLYQYKAIILGIFLEI
jgi:hypothetical protein